MTPPIPRKHLHLEAEQSDGVDDVVLPVGSGGRQQGWQVVDPHEEEEKETQEVAPDVHRLIRKNEYTAT